MFNSRSPHASSESTLDLICLFDLLELHELIPHHLSEIILRASSVLVLKSIQKQIIGVYLVILSQQHPFTIFCFNFHICPCENIHCIFLVDHMIIDETISFSLLHFFHISNTTLWNLSILLFFFFVFLFSNLCFPP